MNDFYRRLKNSCRIDDFDLDQNDTVAQEVRTLYKRKVKKAKMQFWFRFTVAVAITVYGVLGIKYNTGWYVTWALFTAIVGVNAAFVLILWYWQLDAKLAVLKEVKQLRIEVNALTKSKEQPEQAV